MQTTLEKIEPAQDERALPVVLHTRVVTGEGGGPEKTILNSPRFLPRLGYRSICAYMRSPQDEGFAAIRERAAEWQAPLIEVDDHGPLDFELFRKFLQICRENQVAIWHGHDYKSNLVGLWVRRHWPMRLVTTVHGWVKFTMRTPLYYAVDRWCLRRYERVICVSDDYREKCVQAGVPESRCVKIENAIDTEQFQRRRSTAAAKASLGLDPARRLIGAIGRLSAEKGFDVLIRSFARLAESDPTLDLMIVGAGDNRERLETLANQLGLGARVKLPGFRADVSSLYEAFDVFALSSYREGLPNVVLEAMAMETPVVATRVSGVPRLIEHQRDGLLVEAGQVDELTTALNRMLESDELRQRLARNARETIERRYSFQRRMEKVAGVYNELGAVRQS